MSRLAKGPSAGRIPAWLKAGLPDAASLAAVRGQVSARGLNTICFEARCPNKRQCFQEGAVTFLVMGRNCTRHCSFCNVAGVDPEPIDPTEPGRLRAAVSALGLDYAIVTSVTRDDLPDGGAAHFEACVRALREIERPVAIEVLTPDFGGNHAAARKVAGAPVDVFAHNIETTERLYGRFRDRACYRRSLDVLEYVARTFTDVIVKSGLILGIGETLEEVMTTLGHLRDAGCAIVTVGQYMRPSRMHLPVKEYLDPAVFDEIAAHARQMGLIAVCGPRVRSSFRAGPAFREAKLRRQRCA